MNTGRAGAIGSAILDVALGKKFFYEHSILPAVPIREDLYTYPAPDFTNLNGGAVIARAMSKMEFTIGNPGNFGWDMGGAKGEVLIIAGGQRPKQTLQGLFISSALPSAGDPPNGSYLFSFGQGGATAELFKRNGGSYTSLGTDTWTRQDFAVTAPAVGVALYYNDATNRLVVFIRYGSDEWHQVLDITDSTFTTMRYAGVWASNGGGGVGDHFRSMTPLGIYSDV